MISEISNGISGKVYEIWQQFVTPCYPSWLEMDLSRRKWSPATTGPAGLSVADLVAIDGPARPSMAAMDGPGTLPQVVPAHEFCYR